MQTSVVMLYTSSFVSLGIAAVHSIILSPSKLSRSAAVSPLLIFHCRKKEIAVYKIERKGAPYTFDPNRFRKEIQNPLRDFAAYIACHLPQRSFAGISRSLYLSLCKYSPFFIPSDFCVCSARGVIQYIQRTPSRLMNPLNHAHNT